MLDDEIVSFAVSSSCFKEVHGIGVETAAAHRRKELAGVLVQRTALEDPLYTTTAGATTVQRWSTVWAFRPTATTPSCHRAPSPMKAPGSPDCLWIPWRTWYTGLYLPDV